MGGGVILLAGFLEPICGNGIVLSHPLAQVAHDAEVVLSPGVAFPGRLAEPLGGFLEIFIDADSLVKQKPALVVLVGGGVFAGDRFPGHGQRPLGGGQGCLLGRLPGGLGGRFFRPRFRRRLGRWLDHRLGGRFCCRLRFRFRHWLRRRFRHRWPRRRFRRRLKDRGRRGRGQ